MLNFQCYCRKCEHAVHLAGIGAVNIEPKVCWFIMEMLAGESMDFTLLQAPVGDVECIKVTATFPLISFASFIKTFSLTHAPDFS